MFLKTALKKFQSKLVRGRPPGAHHNVSDARGEHRSVLPETEYTYAPRGQDEHCTPPEGPIVSPDNVEQASGSTTPLTTTTTIAESPESEEIARENSDDEDAARVLHILATIPAPTRPPRSPSRPPPPTRRASPAKSKTFHLKPLGVPPHSVAYRATFLSKPRLPTLSTYLCVSTRADLRAVPARHTEIRAKLRASMTRPIRRTRGAKRVLTLSKGGERDAVVMSVWGSCALLNAALFRAISNPALKGTHPHLALRAVFARTMSVVLTKQLRIIGQESTLDRMPEGNLRTTEMKARTKWRADRGSIEAVEQLERELGIGCGSAQQDATPRTPRKTATNPRTRRSSQSPATHISPLGRSLRSRIPPLPAGAAPLTPLAPPPSCHAGPSKKRGRGECEPAQDAPPSKKRRSADIALSAPPRATPSSRKRRHADSIAESEHEISPSPPSKRRKMSAKRSAADLADGNIEGRVTRSSRRVRKV